MPNGIWPDVAAAADALPRPHRAARRALHLIAASDTSNHPHSPRRSGSSHAFARLQVSVRSQRACHHQRDRKLPATRLPADTYRDRRSRWARSRRDGAHHRDAALTAHRAVRADATVTGETLRAGWNGLGDLAERGGGTFVESTSFFRHLNRPKILAFAERWGTATTCDAHNRAEIAETNHGSSLHDP